MESKYTYTKTEVLGTTSFVYVAPVRVAKLCFKLSFLFSTLPFLLVILASPSTSAFHFLSTFLLSVLVPPAIVSIFRNTKPLE